MANQDADTVVLADFHASREYLALTAKQRTWLDVFISTQDADQATKTAYNFATDACAKLFNYQIKANTRVRAALGLYLGLSEQDLFLEDLAQTIRRAPKGSDRQVRAQALYARLKFGVSTPDGDAEPESERKSEPPATSKAASDSRVPSGARSLRDKTTGELKGYVTAVGEYVQLAAVEVTR